MRLDKLAVFTRVVAACVFVAGALPSHAQQPLPPNVQLGLGWLQSQVQADGSLAGEAGSLAAPLQARTEALTTLSVFASAPPALVSAVRADASDHVEGISRRIAALTAAGDPVATMGGALIGLRRADGGWGYDASFESNALDAAFALASLHAAGLGTGTIASEGIGYLVNSRVLDGGWGINGQSNIYTTAAVLATLEAYSSAFILEGSIANARDYLLARRTSGRYADAFEDATAFLALATTTGDPAVLQPLVDALTTSQSSNGSWDNDPYVTALALRALAGWSGGYGSLKGRVTDSATNAPLVGATVTLSAFGTFTTTTDANGAFSFADVRPGSHGFAISALGYGVFSGTATIRAGQQSDVGLLKLRRDGVQGATVRGKVRDQPTQAPLDAVAITLSVGTQGFQATSDANGDYLFADVPAGNATINASRNGYRNTSGSVTLAAGNVYDVAINMLPGTSTVTALLGNVRNAATGAVIAGASVAVQGNQGQGTRSTTTNASGAYTFDSMFSGLMTITVSASGFTTQARQVTLPANSVLTVPFDLAPVTPPSGGMELLARAVDGRTLAPIADVVVTAQYGTVTHSTNSGPDGRFTLPGYTGGQVRLTFAKAGYETTTFNISPAGVALPNLGDFPLLPERAGSTLANLSITNIDRSLLTQGMALDVSGNFRVTVQNAGPNPTPGGFAVLAFLDRDNDRRFTPGTDVMLGEARAAGALVADASITVAIPLTGELPFRDAPIHAWVDSGQEVVEGDEDNNVRSSAEFCRQCQSATTLPPLPSPPSLSLGADYAPFYKAFLLGTIPGVDQRYGFALPKRGDSCTIYFGGAANAPNGRMFSVRVFRDENSRIVGFDPTRTEVAATAPYNDGGAIYYGAENHILAAQWPVNNLGVYREGQTAPGKTIALGGAPFNVASSLAAINVVPEGFPGAGLLKLVSWAGGQWYTATMRPDGNGSLEFATFARVNTVTVPGGPEGFVYVPKGSPAFGRDGMIFSDYSDNRLSAYEVDANGDPIISTRKLFMNGVAGAEGAATDPVTGDYIFTTFGGLNQAVIVRGFNKVVGVSDLTASRGSVALDTTGRVASITARIGNAGPEANPHSIVSFHALRNGAAAEKLGDVPVASLLSGAYVDVTFTLPQATTLPGVIAIVDAGRSIPECNEDNNSTPVAVEPLLGVISIQTNEAGYFPGSTVAISSSVMNPGTTTKGYQVAVSIVDDAGTLVQDLGLQNVNALAGGATAVVANTWLVPNPVAGTYRARAVLFNADALQIGVAEAPFLINASTGTAPAITGTVTLDRATYAPRATVNITARVSNASSNAIFDNVTVRERILDPDGVELFAASRVIAQLAAGAFVEMAFPAPLPNVRAGNYLVQQELLSAAGASLDLRTARFVVESSGESGFGITGTLAATPAAVNQGDPVELAALVRNQGNSALANLPVTLRAVNPDIPAAPVYSRTDAYSIAQDGQQAITQVWDTNTAPAGTYVAVLSVAPASGEISLAQTLVRIGVITPFAFEPKVEVPVNSEQTSNTVTIAGIIVPARIRIAGGEYSVNGGAFVATEGTVVAGDLVTVRLKAAATDNTLATATLTVANFSAEFGVTTVSIDITPDAFTFADKTGVPVATLITSDSATITGINRPVPIRVEGGEYSVNGGPFTSAPGTVVNGDIVRMRVLSSSSFDTTAAATVTVSELAVSFQVRTTAAAEVETMPTLSGDARVLVLLACRHDSDVECNAERRAFFEQYLTDLGIEHRIVLEPAEFQVELRSGRYDTYWVSGWGEKLKGVLMDEVLEATFRGETLILDGVHDQRNKDLDDAVGVNYKGKPAGMSTVTLGAPFLPAGSFPVAGGKAIRVELAGGVKRAAFNTGDPALVTHDYGFGKGLLFAFDLVGTMMAQPASTLLRATTLNSVVHVSPGVPALFTGGAYVPLSVSLGNAEPVPVQLIVTATLPPGVTLAAGAPPAVQSGATVTWNVALAANATVVLDWAVRLPDASGTHAIAIAVRQVYGTTAVTVGSATLSTEVRGLASRLTGVLAELRALALTVNKERKARDDAVAALESAQAKIAVASYEAAIAALVDAAVQLDAVTSLSVRAHQAAIGQVLKEAGQRWWSALPPCPPPSAGAACRRP